MYLLLKWKYSKVHIKWSTNAVVFSNNQCRSLSLSQQREELVSLSETQKHQLKETEMSKQSDSKYCSIKDMVSGFGSNRSGLGSYHILVIMIMFFNLTSKKPFCGDYFNYFKNTQCFVREHGKFSALYNIFKCILAHILCLLIGHCYVFKHF